MQKDRTNLRAQDKQPLRRQLLPGTGKKQKNLIEIQKSATLIKAGSHKKRSNMKRTFLEEKK